MIESILVGAGSKLIFNFVNGLLHNSEQKAERKYLQDKELLAGHLELARIRQKNFIMNLTASLCAIMVIGTFCFIGVYAMYNPTETDILIPIRHGFLGRLFNQPDSILQAGRTPGVLFQQFFEVTIALVTMFALPSKRS